MRNHFKRTLLSLLALALLLGGSVLQAGDVQQQARAFTRPIEFNFNRWIFQAVWSKWEQLSLGGAQFLPAESRTSLVETYLQAVRDSAQAERDLQDALADPEKAQSDEEIGELRARRNALQAQRDALSPWAESVLEFQVSAALSQAGLTFLGQPIPPVLFHITQPPQALITSPREKIEMQADISIDPDLSIEEVQQLEANVEARLGVSALVVRIGGIGVYPTMVLQSSDINWLCQTVVHEWTHNYLQWHPLGIRYGATPELRTINETTASIAGEEIGRMVVATWYPEALPPPPQPAQNTPPASQTPPPFDFRAEMHHTRVMTDALLARGEVERAEWYMEVRRRFLWEHGYHIRKLNQAYFAFHGAYAAGPGGGAAGNDPVGEAVRALRQASPSVGAFVRRIAWVFTYQQLRTLSSK